MDNLNLGKRENGPHPITNSNDNSAVYTVNPEGFKGTSYEKCYSNFKDSKYGVYIEDSTGGEIKNYMPDGNILGKAVGYFHLGYADGEVQSNFRAVAKPNDGFQITEIALTQNGETYIRDRQDYMPDGIYADRDFNVFTYRDFTNENGVLSTSTILKTSFSAVTRPKMIVNTEAERVNYYFNDKKTVRWDTNSIYTVEQNSYYGLLASIYPTAVAQHKLYLVTDYNELAGLSYYQNNG